MAANTSKPPKFRRYIVIHCSPVATADVYHMYAVQQSWAWRAHRTLQEGGMWFDALDHPERSVSEQRRRVCTGMCASFLPRRAREWQWRTVMDDWAIGRQEEDGCVLCLLDKKEVRDSTRHAVLSCPYAAAVLDAVWPHRP